MKIPQTVKKIFEIFESNKYEIYLVGGCVRDIVLGITPHDYDFTTNATPEEMKILASKEGIEIIPTGEKYGTLTFHVENDFYEITTFRSEQKYSDGRRPDAVSFSKKLEDDLCRRDFTFNAMCFKYNASIKGVQLIDLYNGKRDLKQRIIKTVGKADDRFKEDALRILRAIRFAYKLNFTLSLDVRRAIVENVSLLKNVSMERIRDELFQIFSYCKEYDNNRGPALDKVLCFLFENQIKLSRLNIYTNPLLMFANITLFRYKNDLKIDFIRKFKLSNEQVDEISKYLKCFEVFSTNPEKDSRIVIKQCLDICNKDKKLVENAIQLVTDNVKYYLFDSENLNKILNNVIDKNEAIVISDLKINGNDLLELGLKGKEVGNALNRCKELVWAFPDKNEKEILIEYTRNGM